MVELVLHRTCAVKPDGRRIVYFDFLEPWQKPPRRALGDPNQPLPSRAPELRWNPLMREWTVCAGYRMDRPHLPEAEECPLCPRGFEFPNTTYDIASFENLHPAYAQQAKTTSTPGSSLYPTRPAVGRCEVVVYTPVHDKSLAQMGVDTVYKLMYVWADRYRELMSISEVQAVVEFENKGEVVGVTLHHPHGQIYAFPYVPPRLERELQSAMEFSSRRRCVFCDIVQEEGKAGRVVVEAERFLACVPYFARYPYEVHVYGKTHGVTDMTAFDEADRRELAQVLDVVINKYDSLFGFSFPYMMLFHQLPESYSDEWHFHVEFYPPHRAAKKLKYAAAIETGAGVWLNDAFPEVTARRLQECPPHTVREISIQVVETR